MLKYVEILQVGHIPIVEICLNPFMPIVEIDQDVNRGINMFLAMTGFISDQLQNGGIMRINLLI